MIEKKTSTIWGEYNESYFLLQMSAITFFYQSAQLSHLFIKK